MSLPTDPAQTPAPYDERAAVVRIAAVAADRTMRFCAAAPADPDGFYRQVFGAGHADVIDDLTTMVDDLMALAMAASGDSPVAVDDLALFTSAVFCGRRHTDWVADPLDVDGRSDGTGYSLLNAMWADLRRHTPTLVAYLGGPTRPDAAR